jgi:hypothetical protein
MLFWFIIPLLLAAFSHKASAFTMLPITCRIRCQLRFPTIIIAKPRRTGQHWAPELDATLTTYSHHEYICEEHDRGCTRTNKLAQPRWSSPFPGVVRLKFILKAFFADGLYSQLWERCEDLRYDIYHAALRDTRSKSYHLMRRLAISTIYW